jgi:acetyl esterase/lipase
LATDCSLTVADFFKQDADEKALAKAFLVKDPTDDPAVRSIMMENSPGLIPRGMRVFIAQGTNDEVVEPDVTRSYAKEICSGGAAVTFHNIPGGSHMWAGRDGAFAASQWMDLLFKGGSPANHC